MIASLNRYSEHPLAQAVVNFAKNEKGYFAGRKIFESLPEKE
jgi:cation transport ATPase